MDKWFNPKFEKNYRKYTKKRLNKVFDFEGFFRKFSVTTWFIIINVIVFILVALLMGVFGFNILTDQVISFRMELSR